MEFGYLAKLTQADFFTVKSLYIFKNWTSLFRNIWILFFWEEIHTLQALAHPNGFPFSDAAASAELWLNSPPHHRSPPWLESASADMQSPHFRSDPAQAQFLDPALPTFATVFGRLLFKSLLGLRQFLHCLTGWSHCLSPPWRPLIPSAPEGWDPALGSSWSSFLLPWAQPGPGTSSPQPSLQAPWDCSPGLFPASTSGQCFLQLLWSPFAPHHMSPAQESRLTKWFLAKHNSSHSKCCFSALAHV